MTKQGANIARGIEIARTAEHATKRREAQLGLLG